MIGRMTFANFVGGKWVPSESGATLENRNPANARDLIGLFADSTANDAVAAIAAAKRAFESWRLVPAPQARRDPVPRRSAHRGAQGRVRARHDARNGQGARRDPRRRAGSDRHDLLPRRRRPPPARADGAVGAARQVCDVAAPADRRVLADHAVEFSDGDSVVEDHPGAGVRQHGGVETVGADAAVGRAISSRCSRRPACLPAW